MSNEELAKLIQDNIEPTKHIEQLYVNNLPIIRKTASKFTAYAELEDLLQEGFFGLHEAVQHYESSNEVKFITYAVYWIKQAMQRYIENCGRTIRIPTHLMSDIVRYRRFSELYREEHNREPNVAELCRHLKCSVKKLDHIRKAYQQYNIKSLDAELTNDNGDFSTLGENCASSEDIENNIIEQEMSTQLKNNLWQIVQDSLTEQENEVIIEKYRNNRTRQEIADIVGGGVYSVRSMEEKAMRKLRLPRMKRILEDGFGISETAGATAYKGGIISDNIRYSSTERAAFKDMYIKI